LNYIIIYFFYILSPVSGKNITNAIEYVIECLKKIFPKEKDIDNLKKLYEEKSELIFDKKIYYPKKGDCKINFEKFMKRDKRDEKKSLGDYFLEKEKNIETLYHYYDSMFKILLSCNLESILISGETCYKTHLVKELLNNEKISMFH